MLILGEHFSRLIYLQRQSIYMFIYTHILSYSYHYILIPEQHEIRGTYLGHGLSIIYRWPSISMDPLYPRFCILRLNQLWIMKYSQYSFTTKKSSNKWTPTVQTCVVQGSTIISNKSGKGREYKTSEGNLQGWYIWSLS